MKIEYPIEGLSDESHAGYCRDAVKHLLQQCPDIDGVLLRVNFESGIPEGPLDFWDTYIQGIADAGRPVKLDMRAKGITFELIENAQKKGLEVIASTKFTAEHMGLPYHQAQIRIDELERGGRGFTRYGYADLLKRPRDYDVMYRVWMFGTQPVLLWGDPDYVATLARTCAIADGVGFEHSDPLSFMGRRGSDFPGLRYGEIFADKSLQFYRWAFQRYWYTYLMFGRLLYNPSTDAEVWLRELRDRFGDEAAPHIAEALRYASKTLPLVTMSFSPSAMNFAYWPEMFTNLPIVETPEPTHYRDAPDSGRVEPLDTAIFYRAVDYVEDYMSGQRRGRYSPIEVNRWLRGYAANALAALDKAEKVADTTSPELRGIGLDVRVQARLALFFAHRFVATTHYEFYKQAGDYDSLSSAVSAYREALGEWSQIVQLTKGTYRDNLPFREIPSAKGHWADREEAFLEDLRNMEGVGLSFLENYATGPVSFAHVPLRLQRPDSVQVTTTVKGWDSVNRVAVHFRTDPGQPFREVVMGQRPDQPPVYLADLPVDGTPTGPLQYYMTATPGSGETISHPVDGAAKPLEIILSGETPAFRISQTPPKSFRRGGPLKLELQVEGPTGPRGVNLFYRHLNQAEYVQEMAMANEGGVYTATVPGDYTDSPYDLLYYFEIKDQAGGAMMHPGFDEHCSGTPYFVVYAEE